jgi:hypothetical protein
VTEALVDEELRSRLIGADEKLDTSGLSDLTDLLLMIRPSAAFPNTHLVFR